MANMTPTIGFEGVKTHGCRFDIVCKSGWTTSPHIIAAILSAKGMDATMAFMLSQLSISVKLEDCWWVVTFSAS